ncbi:unnamed protein product [Coffea canephora]|uniref:DH200=94 genomic scaffold, scaffold_478 n=1 Tax=Coffea canephora TaxID=49390 RepID=A0A068VFQ3_COFCA|nr:unnamed protein product [Coffea canephora]
MKQWFPCGRKLIIHWFLLEKILNQFQKLCFEKNLEEIWEMICEFLLHPHL